MFNAAKTRTPPHRVFLTRAVDGLPVSPFHDVPLRDATESDAHVFNMVVEIPRWSNAKMEISKTELLNPIRQDTKNGIPRFVANLFPHHGYPWNYGALPQTWEDPANVLAETGTHGDNDPLDVCEIGSAVLPTAAVRRVKVLGALAMIDEGETDWKLIAIDCADAMAPLLDSIADINVHMPGLLSATREWFRSYKVPDGKPRSAFAFNGEYVSRDQAIKVINETHAAWKALILAQPSGANGIISCVNTTLDTSLGQHTISMADQRVAALIDSLEPFNNKLSTSAAAVVEKSFFDKDSKM